jgi:hypothetical protein
VRLSKTVQTGQVFADKPKPAQGRKDKQRLALRSKMRQKKQRFTF